ncbi:MAG TPA: LptF/LptG family permease, partial [Gemmatimonadaceae bacterium]
TFALKEQIINPVKEGQLYLRAGEIGRDESGRMRDVTIYDVSDGSRRRTIFADSGTLVFAANKRDLIMHLYDGMVMSAPTAQPGQLDRIYYRQELMKIRDVLGGDFTKVDADTASKGEREMNVCEMQTELQIRVAAFDRAYSDSLHAAWKLRQATGKKAGPEPSMKAPRKVGGIGAVYCTFITKYLPLPMKYLHIPTLNAAEVPASIRASQQAAAQDTSKKVQDTTKKVRDTTKKALDTTKKVLDTTKKAQDTTKKAQDTTKQATAITAAKRMPLPTDSVTALINGVWKRTLFREVPPGAFVPETAMAIPINRPATTPAPTFVPNPAAAPSVAGRAPDRPIAPPPPGTPAALPPGAQPIVPPAPPGTPLPATNSTLGSSSPVSASGGNDANSVSIEVSDSKIRLDEARHWRNRYDIEIQKKFSLAASCLVFVLVGAPIALRFPRGGVGLVMGVGLVVFAVYYVALIGGESLANASVVSPFIAMWAANIIFLVIGLIFIIRMGNEGVTGRGGNFGELTESVRRWFLRRRGVSE